MNRNLKKRMAVLLLGILLVTVSVSMPALTKSKAVTAKALQEIPLPIVKKPLTITYWCRNDVKVAASMKTFAEIKCYLAKEKLTGVKVKFIHPPLGQEVEQFNLMMASSELPDIIYYNWDAAPGGAKKALADKRIIRLNSYIARYAPNFRKLLAHDPLLRKECQLDDGTIYMFPFIYENVKLNAATGFQLRKDWLDKLNLKTPTTINEWYTVLKAFRDKDPNGNGKKDEIPFTAQTNNIATNVHDFAPAFGILGGFYIKDKKVAYGPIEKNYQTFLKTMAQWYNEKLIDPEIAVCDAKSFDYKVTNNLAGSYCGRLFGNMGRFMSLMQTSQPKFNLVGAPWPVGAVGKAYCTYNIKQKIAGNYGAAISAKCKHIKEVVEWLDYNYSPQGHMLFNFGIQGESYTMAGNYPKYTNKVWKNSKGLPYDQALAQYALSIIDGPFVQDTRYMEQVLKLPQQKAATETWNRADCSLALPKLTFTKDESYKIASIMSQINTYQTEMVARFVMGKDPISHFDNYVKAIQSMGLKEVLKIHNDALLRYNKRK